MNSSDESSEGTLAISYSIKDESYLQEIKINKNWQDEETSSMSPELERNTSR